MLSPLIRVNLNIFEVALSFLERPLIIDTLSITPALVMAPLHEITDLPFRRMIREMGGVGLTVSEMVSVEALVRNAAKAFQMLHSEKMGPYAIQLVGFRPENLAECARMAQEHGADMVDLNMGCPASNVTKGFSGSALMRDFHQARRCVKALVQAVNLPVTVKMRVGWDEAQKLRGEYLDFIRMFEDEGVKAVTIHPRTRAQQYTGHADWTCIKRAVDAGFSIPIIGNGDVRSPEDAFQMVQETGCAAVMIGRIALTNPFIFRQIVEPGLIVTTDMRIDAILRYFRILIECFDEREALHKIKKIGAAFTKGIPGGVKFRQNLHAVSESQVLLDAIEDLRHEAEHHAS